MELIAVKNLHCVFSVQDKQVRRVLMNLIGHQSYRIFREGEDGQACAWSQSPRVYEIISNYKAVSADNKTSDDIQKLFSDSIEQNNFDELIKEVGVFSQVDESFSVEELTEPQLDEKDIENQYYRILDSCKTVKTNIVEENCSDVDFLLNMINGGGQQADKPDIDKVEDKKGTYQSAADREVNLVEEKITMPIVVDQDVLENQEENKQNNTVYDESELNIDNNTDDIDISSMVSELLLAEDNNPISEETISSDIPEQSIVSETVIESNQILPESNNDLVPDEVDNNTRLFHLAVINDAAEPCLKENIETVSSEPVQESVKAISENLNEPPVVEKGIESENKIPLDVRQKINDEQLQKVSQIINGICSSDKTVVNCFFFFM